MEFTIVISILSIIFIYFFKIQHQLRQHWQKVEQSHWIRNSAGVFILIYATGLSAVQADSVKPKIFLLFDKIQISDPCEQKIKTFLEEIRYLHPDRAVQIKLSHEPISKTDEDEVFSLECLLSTNTITLKNSDQEYTFQYSPLAQGYRHIDWSNFQSRHHKINLKPQATHPPLATLETKELSWYSNPTRKWWFWAALATAGAGLGVAIYQLSNTPNTVHVAFH